MKGLKREWKVATLLSPSSLLQKELEESQERMERGTLEVVGNSAVYARRVSRENGKGAGHLIGCSIAPLPLGRVSRENGKQAVLSSEGNRRRDMGRVSRENGKVLSDTLSRLREPLEESQERMES